MISINYQGKVLKYQISFDLFYCIGMMKYIFKNNVFEFLIFVKCCGRYNNKFKIIFQYVLIIILYDFIYSNKDKYM